MKKTISIRIGKGSISHNNRKFVAKNVDEKRVKDNVVLCNVALKETYNDLFGAALTEYNAKQKRKDRRIADYLDHIENGKQEKPFYELIFQIGNKDDTSCGSADAQTAVEVLQEYYKGFVERNPHIRVFNAVIHLDEATPHLHVDFVPFATEQKRGLSTRNSLSGALEQQGFIAKTNLETPAKQWTDHEKLRLAEVMLKRGIEWEQLGTHNEHLSVLDYKKQEREKEVEYLEGKVKSTEFVLEHRKELLTDMENVIDKLDTLYQEKNAEVEQLDGKIGEKKTELAETAAAVTENREVLEQTAQKVSAIRDLDEIQTKKTLFGGNVTVSQTDYANLSNLAKKQIAAESKEHALTEENAKLKEENAALADENSDLREKASAARTLKFSLSALQRELDTWKQRYQRIIDFVESLGLKEKLEMFLNPARHIKRGGR